MPGIVRVTALPLIVVTLDEVMTFVVVPPGLCMVEVRVTVAVRPACVIVRSGPPIVVTRV